MSTLKHLQIFLPSKTLKKCCKVRIKNSKMHKMKKKKKKKHERTFLMNYLHWFLQKSYCTSERLLCSVIYPERRVCDLSCEAEACLWESRRVCRSQTLRPSPRLIYINRPHRSHGPAALRLRLWEQRHPVAGTGHCSWGRIQENQLLTDGSTQNDRVIIIHLSWIWLRIKNK